MNYRHAFHAGNFADLQKHAILLALLKVLTAGEAPLSVIDTHAGAGAYDLGGDMAQRSGEAAAGIGRLLAMDEVPAVVRAPGRGGEGAERRRNGRALSRLAAADRPPSAQDRPVHSLRATARRLRQPAPHPGALRLRPGGQGRRLRDGRRRGRGRGRTFVLIDPPFERSDDYAQTVATTKAVLAKDRDAVIAAWMPLKDLETFDAFMRAMETVTKDALAAELAPAAADGPDEDERLRDGHGRGAQVHRGRDRRGPTWLADNLGDAGAKARVWRA